MTNYKKITNMLTKIALYINREDVKGNIDYPDMLTITESGNFRVHYKHSCSEEFKTYSEAEQEFEKFITNVISEK